MKGLDRIESLRRSGLKPAYVAITDTPPMPGLLDDAQYELKDVPEFFDLRVLVGLLVVIQGDDQGLVDRWARAAMKAGASTVLAQSGDKWENYRLQGIDQ